MITVDSCKYMQEAVFSEKITLPNGEIQYRFSIPTLLPFADKCTGVTVSKSSLVNKNSDAIILSNNYIEDCNTITLPYNIDRFGEPKPGDAFVVCFLGGDPTRCTILERR